MTVYLGVCFSVFLFLSQAIYYGCLCIQLQDLHENLPKTDAVDEFHYHEVMTPHLYHHRRRRNSNVTPHLQHPEEITVILTAFNKIFTLDLKLNTDLFASSYIERHFTEGDGAVVHRPAVQRTAHCHYHGSLRRQPGSVVAVSTCSGISGMIADRGDVYYIEPTAASMIDVHRMYRASDAKRNHTCGHQGGHSLNHLHRPRPHRLKRALYWPYDQSAKTRIVELYVVNDHKQYQAYKQDVNKVIERTKTIINIVSSLYRQLNIYVALTGVEVWSAQDRIAVTSNPDDTMNNFLKYRKLKISPIYQNDNAQLITGITLGDGVVGKALKGTICSFQYSGGINMDHSSLVGPVATTVAHEMGHNFGMDHDSSPCSCPEPKCIMAASSGGHNPTKWSSCSKEQLADTFHQGQDYCLMNVPKKTYSVCGNGFKEEGEECDCGLAQDCNTHCCNATTCRLTVNATCATGSCCDLEICQMKPITTPCRPVTGECDLPEFCSGTSEFCPHDVHKQNTEQCLGGKGYCHGGKCGNRDTQCRKLWGTTGKNSHNVCYTHYNRLGLANGHCGFNWIDKSFKKCLPEDVLCGMLHCEHRTEKLSFWKEALSYTILEDWVEANKTRYDCKGAILDVGLDSMDPGMVPNGAKCGSNMMCLNQRCIHVADHIKTLAKCPDCNGHGVCNSKGQCHCDVGYAPPLCDSPGPGGSEHSGPINIHSSNESLKIGLIVLFLVIIPAIVVAGLFSYRHRDRLKKWWTSAAAPAVKYQTTACQSPSNNTVPHAPPKVCHAVARQPSYRDMEISDPVFQSTTNRNPSWTLKHNKCNGVPPQRPPPPRRPPGQTGPSSTAGVEAFSAPYPGGGVEVFSTPYTTGGAPADDGSRSKLVPTRPAPVPSVHASRTAGKPPITAHHNPHVTSPTYVNQPPGGSTSRPYENEYVYPERQYDNANVHGYSPDCGMVDVDLGEPNTNYDLQSQPTQKQEAQGFYENTDPMPGRVSFSALRDKFDKMDVPDVSLSRSTSNAGKKPALLPKPKTTGAGSRPPLASHSTDSQV